MSATVSFFSKKENNDSLKIFSQILRSESSVNKVAEMLCNIVDLMVSNAGKFDEFCLVNIKWIGESFMWEVGRYSDSKKNDKSDLIRAIFVMAFRFLCELEFMQPAQPSSNVRDILLFVEEHPGLFSDEDRREIVYAKNLMPTHILKELINSPAIADLREFSKNLEESSKLKDYIDSIRMELKGLTSSYNFVGLVDGFKELVVIKEGEKRFAFWSLVGVVILVLLPPVVQIVYIVRNVDYINSNKDVLLYALPAILAIEVMLIYFFRVVLAQFRSVKAQILQLQLRMALCQFIESYAEHSAKIKKNNGGALAKFEALVFSGLVPDNESIPSTFDGVEQLASLIKSIRGSN